jgi:hypothetical protein
MTDNTSIPRNLPSSYQSDSLKSLGLHWAVGSVILEAYLDGPHPCLARHGITRACCPYLAIKVQHPYLSLDQRSSMGLAVP